MADEFGARSWSGTVREGFLRGLAAHGLVRRACRENGISTSCAYYYRKRDADFAKLWANVIARFRAERAARVKLAAAKAKRRDGFFRDYRVRSDGWTERRTRMFLRALAETGCVRDACARARVSDSSAYTMRRRDPAFAAAWEKALDAAIPTLEQAAWERAVEGWDEVVWKDGVEVSRKRRYSDGLLRFLLDRASAGRPGKKASEKELVAFAQEAAHAAGGYFEVRATSEATNAAILKKLEMIDKARALETEDAAREAAEAAEAEAEVEAARSETPPAGRYPRITGG